MRRRDLVGLTALVAAAGITGCDAKSSPDVAESKPTSATPSRASLPSSAVAQKGLPQAVLDRLAESDLPVDLSSRDDLYSASTSRAVVVGDIDPFYVKLAASYAQKTVDYFEPKLSTPLPGKVLVLLARTKTEYRAWGGEAPSSSYGNYARGTDRRSMGWVVMNGGLRVSSQTATMMNEAFYLEYYVRAAVFQAMIFRRATGWDRAPRWVIDGFTRWAQATEPVYAANLSEYFTERLPPATVPTKDSDFKHDPHGLAVGRAFLFVYYLAYTYGESTALSFCEQMIQHPKRGAEREFPRVFGVSLAEAEKGWASQYKHEIAVITGKTVG